jgi:hypothetical protein
MTSIEERRQLLRIMDLLEEDTGTTSNIDVSNRSRDVKGRFLPERKKEESRSPSVRNIRLVKVRGSYGTFKVKTKWFSNEEKIHLYLVIGFIVLAIAI